MNLADQPVRDLSKAWQIRKHRIKPTQRQMGAISASVRREVNARTIFAPVGCCERCGRNRNGCWTLEQAHIVPRGRMEHKTTANDLLRLCGPSTQSGTCHWWIDNIREGREWAISMKERLEMN